MVLFLYFVTDVTLLHDLERFKSVAIESVCRQIYRRKDKLSRDIPTVIAREQKGVFISQMCSSMYSQWHKDGTCYGSTHPATNRVIDLGNLKWVEAKMAINHTWNQSLFLYTDLINCLKTHTHLYYVYIIRGQAAGLRAGNPPPPSQVNKAGAAFCYCCSRN